MTTKHTLIIGCGYLGQRVANLLLTRHERVSALTRSQHNAAALEQVGIEPIVGDIMRPDSLTLPQVDNLVYAVGFDRSSTYSKYDVYVTGLANVLNQLPPPKLVLYVSSTSVYGQTDGEWVDEFSATRPDTDGGKVCLEAEQLLRSRVPSASIIRLAGIYGPDRLLRKLDAIRTNQPISGNPEAYLNLIHVDDAARLVTQLTTTKEPPPLCLGCDGNPLTRREFYKALSQLVDAKEPSFDARLPTRNSSSGINKRCRSTILSTLPFEPDFPTAIQGLVHAVHETPV